MKFSSDASHPLSFQSCEHFLDSHCVHMRWSFGEISRGTPHLDHIREFVSLIEPRPPEAVLRFAAALRYRDFLTVGLILRERNRFKDHWIYIHGPSVKVGRVQNYKSWSPEKVPDPDYCCYGL